MLANRMEHLQDKHYSNVCCIINETTKEVQAERERIRCCERRERTEKNLERKQEGRPQEEAEKKNKRNQVEVKVN